MLFNGSGERTQISLTGSDAVREEIAATGCGSPSALRASSTRPPPHPGPPGVRNSLSSGTGSAPLSGCSRSAARACRAPVQGRRRYLHRFATKRTLSIDTTAAGDATQSSLERGKRSCDFVRVWLVGVTHWGIDIPRSSCRCDPMPVMSSTTYDALRAAGAPEDKAREAAEELAGYESRLASIDSRLASLEGKFTVMPGAMGVNAAATIAISWRIIQRP